MNGELRPAAKHPRKVRTEKRWRALGRLGLATLAGAGCEFDASGTGNGHPPELACGLDLSSTQFYVDLEPQWAGLTPGVPLADEPF